MPHGCQSLYGSGILSLVPSALLEEARREGHQELNAHMKKCRQLRNILEDAIRATRDNRENFMLYRPGLQP